MSFAEASRARPPPERQREPFFKQSQKRNTPPQKDCKNARNSQKTPIFKHPHPRPTGRKKRKKTAFRFAPQARISYILPEERDNESPALLRFSYLGKERYAAEVKAQYFEQFLPPVLQRS